MLQRGTLRAVVLYWYQGRGRVEANEYRVKWHLLWDAAVTQRSDEALVRIVVPFERDEDAAVAFAERVAATILPAVDAALPAG
jgi:EpsI family protein